MTKHIPENNHFDLRLSVVIPVYNEDKNIELTFQTLEKIIDVSHEIIVVYDFDEDTTLPVVRRLSLQFPQLKLVKNNIARGPSGAIRSGIAQARGENVLVIMADLCDDLTQVPQMLSLIRTSADIVCPSRYCRGGDQILTETAYLKALIPRVASFFIKFLTGIPTSDSTNSFKLYSNKMLQDFKLTSTVSFSVTLEIVVKAHCLGYRLIEIPTVWRDRQHGKSNFNLGRSIIVYLPWFLLSFLRGRVIRLPQRYFRKWFGSPEKVVTPNKEKKIEFC